MSRNLPWLFRNNVLCRWVANSIFQRDTEQCMEGPLGFDSLKNGKNIEGASSFCKGDVQLVKMKVMPSLEMHRMGPAGYFC